MKCAVIFLPLLALIVAAVGGAEAAYPDGRPTASLRMDAKDQGRVLRHGDGPNRCDVLGARDIWAFKASDTYYMHYDGAGPKGWLACLATSKDLVHWRKKGPVLDFGDPGTDDSASASYGVTYFDGKNCTWSKKCIGLPSVLPVKDRLAILYDAPGGESKSHMKRDVGLAWLKLPLTPPK